MTLTQHFLSSCHYFANVLFAFVFLFRVAFVYSKTTLRRCDVATLRHAISRQKISNFPYPKSPCGLLSTRKYADVITQISRMDSLPNYLSYGAPLALASHAQGAPLQTSRKVLLR